VYGLKRNWTGGIGAKEKPSAWEGLKLRI